MTITIVTQICPEKIGFSTRYYLYLQSGDDVFYLDCRGKEQAELLAQTIQESCPEVSSLGAKTTMAGGFLVPPPRNRFAVTERIAEY
jgi:hypothetical protein